MGLMFWKNAKLQEVLGISDFKAFLGPVNS
jgi:hypothetical protein